MELYRSIALTIFLSFLIVRANCKESLHFLSIPPTREYNLTEQCEFDIKKLNSNLQNLSTWAVEMWEASAKGESGMLQGNYHQLGNFDECLISKYPHSMKRQYCLVKVNFESEKPRRSPPNFEYAEDILLREGNEIRWSRNEIFWAICAPASCSNQDLKHIVKDYSYISQFSEAFNFTRTISLDDESCQIDTSTEPFTTGSITFILLCVVLIILVTASSAYHQYSAVKQQDCNKVVKAFSLWNNLQQLTSKDEKSLRMTYGLRVLTTSFIIGSHLLGVLSRGPLINREYVENLTDDLVLATSPQLAGTLVDTFFILGGFFAVYSLSRSIKNKNILKILASRYMRLMPLYAFIIFFTATLLVQSGSGPRWHLVMNETEFCQKNWWTNLLFINNYVNSEEMCLIHAWYIPCDFHFFVVAIFLCYFISNPKREKLGLIITVTLLTMSFILPPIIVFMKKLPPILYFANEFTKLNMYQSFFQNVYIKSHTRFSSYAMGLLTGYFYQKYYEKESKKISSVKSTMVFSSSVLVYFASSMILIGCFDMNPPYDPLTSAMFNAFYRPIKSLCICLIILICIFGNVPIVTSFLGSTFMTVVGKLTYGAYLFSLIIQYRDMGTVRESIYFSFLPVYRMNTWYNEISFFLSFIGYVMIEAPCNNLMKIFLESRKKDLIITKHNANSSVVEERL